MSFVNTNFRAEFVIVMECIQQLELAVTANGAYQGKGLWLRLVVMEIPVGGLRA